MKIKYYLRGLGVGIIVTTIILTISFHGKQKDIDDFPAEEIIAKATMLGMVMPEDTEEPQTEAQDAVDEILNNTEITTEQTTVYESTQEPETAQNEEGEPAQDAEEPVQEEQTVPDETAAQTPYRLTVNPGDVCRTVCEKLAAAGLIDDAEAYRKYLSEVGVASFISVGNYDIPYQLSYEEIADILKAGPIEEQQQ